MSGLDTHSQHESQLAIGNDSYWNSLHSRTVMSGLDTHSQQESQLAITNDSLEFPSFKDSYVWTGHSTEILKETSSERRQIWTYLHLRDW